MANGLILQYIIGLLIYFFHKSNGDLYNSVIMFSLGRCHYNALHSVAHTQQTNGILYLSAVNRPIIYLKLKYDLFFHKSNGDLYNSVIIFSLGRYNYNALHTVAHTQQKNGILYLSAVNRPIIYLKLKGLAFFMHRKH